MAASGRSVEGLTVLVTGAGSGIGRAVAAVFGSEQAHVAVTDKSAAAAEAVARTIGDNAKAWPLDVADAGAIERVVADIAAHFGAIDIVVNNAGVAGFVRIDADEYQAVWDTMVLVLLTAHQRVIRAALPHLRKSKAPRIINIASTEALGATALDSAYAAAKSGVTGLTRALAVELGRENITVNCICPGPILTGMTEAIPDANKETFAKRRTALGRYGRPEEIAHMVLNLSLPASSYVTGAVIPVDGGLMARNA